MRQIVFRVMFDIFFTSDIFLEWFCGYGTFNLVESNTEIMYDSVLFGAMLTG